MIFTIHADITIDTATNKVVIHTAEKRVVLVPVNRRAPDAYTIVNDVPGKQIATATDLLRWLSQNVWDKKEIARLTAQPDFDP